MNSGQPSSLLRIVLIFLLVVTAAVVSLLGVNSVASSQQQQQQDSSPGNPSSQGAAAPERKIGIGIPKHLPLKFEIRNLNSDRWVYDLEIDVTNTSTKPIYRLDFFITMPGYKSEITGNKLGFWFSYGSIEPSTLRPRSEIKPEVPAHQRVAVEKCDECHSTEKDSEGHFH